MTPLKISMEQMIALHSFFAEAVAVAEAGLTDMCGSETEIDVLEIRCSNLGEFAESGLRLSEDMLAGVMGRVEGAMPGSLNLVAEPEDALVWAQMVGGADPLETFVALGCELLAGVAAALAEVLESPTEFCDPQLVEEPELAMFVKTHAPSDTLVFSTRLRIEVRDELITAHSHLLVEPKYLSRLLSALSAASH
jgi:hypothetical protein